jgi:hypothetical protein
MDVYVNLRDMHAATTVNFFSGPMDTMRRRWPGRDDTPLKHWLLIIKNLPPIEPSSSEGAFKCFSGFGGSSRSIEAAGWTLR